MCICVCQSWAPREQSLVSRTSRGLFHKYLEGLEAFSQIILVSSWINWKVLEQCKALQDVIIWIAH